jgi:hypothetical protein
MVDLKFKYDGYWRHVSNVTFESNTKTLIGFEVRKNGKFVYRVKRYNWEKIKDMAFIDTIPRFGPKIGL